MPTKFEEKIYNKLRLVPKGKVTTYGQLAKTVESTAYRAVGQAMNKNLFMFKKRNFFEYIKNMLFLSPPQVPCHRVVCSDETIGGFALGIENKIKILKKEGIKVKNNKIVDFEDKLYSF
jgi:methylated-DNA-[protein]-cysteine S-methyltransferase